ncbi:MarR family winged helix-turn-helix transcriptional regulator [Treponema sp. R6D11]
MERGSKGELFILKILSKKNIPLLPSEISETMCISPARISTALGALEKKKQIHRELDTNNRRNILVTITDLGRERLREHSKKMRKHMMNILNNMGEKDALEYVRLTKRFSEIASEIFRNKNIKDI